MLIPNQVLELGQAEQLVTRSVRRWVVGAVTGDARHWNMVWNEFAGTLGTEPARQALTALDRLVRLSCTGAETGFRCHPPCCPFLGRDELILLSILSLCQASGGGASHHLALELVEPQQCDAFVEAAGSLARQIGAAGLILPRRPVPGATAKLDALFAPAGSNAIH